MFQAAIGDSVADRIFLAKQAAWLGFSDRMETKGQLEVQGKFVAVWGWDRGADKLEGGPQMPQIEDGDWADSE
jgi:hypothetical protein